VWQYVTDVSGERISPILKVGEVEEVMSELLGRSNGGNEVGRACSTYWENIKSCGGLVEKHEGRRQLGTPRHRWEDNTKRDLKARGCEGVEWNNFPRRRGKWKVVTNTVINIRVT
jgi:hypothetical protein